MIKCRHMKFILSALIICITLILFSGCCMVDYCSEMYSLRLDEGGISIGSNARYCQVITDYIYCLQSTSRSCRGNLKFHTFQTLLDRQRLEYSCTSFPQSMKPSYGLERRCYTMLGNELKTPMRYCSLFGSRHLRTFDGRFQTCAARGAHPLVNNRYLLVQITHSKLASGENAITMVNVIIRPTKFCTTRKRYEASSDHVELSASFDDGSNFTGVEEQKTTQLTRHNSSYVEIILGHVATFVYIQQQGPFLSVSVRMPESLVQEEFTEESELMCVSGCSRGETMMVEEALANPLSYALCYGILIKVPLKIAIDYCGRAGTKDAFFDACVFDMMRTGNEVVAGVALSAQRNIESLYEQYRKHYSTGRQNVSVYDSKAGYQWTHCAPKAQSTAKLSVSASFMSVLLVILTLI